MPQDKEPPTSAQDGNGMASDEGFVDYVVDQIQLGAAVTPRKMFGEFGLFCEGKIFGVICDNRLFIKPTDAGRAFIGEPVEAPPYPGAKPSFLIEEKVDDPAWLSELVRVTLGELPAPKAKKPRNPGAPSRRAGPTRKD